MKYLEAKDRRERIKKLIEKGWCVTPGELASKFEVNERTIRRDLTRLREEGTDIKFNKTICRYTIGN